MPELFKWRPANMIDWQETFTFKTLKTRMESGKVRTRQKWERPRRNAAPVLVNFLEMSEVDSIYAFFGARLGAKESFYMPSWGRETRLNSAVSVGNTVVNIENASLFTNTPGWHGNFMHFVSINSESLQFLGTVNTIISATQIGLTSPVSYAFPNLSFAQRAYLVRFSTDSFAKQRKGTNIYEVGLAVEEA